MGDLHDRAVEELYETFDWLINSYEDEVFWDEVYLEQDYFENQFDPASVPEGDKGLQVGEMDVLLVGRTEPGFDDVIKYFEVKPETASIRYGEEQCDRCEEFFDGYQVLTEVHTVGDWCENWYDEGRSVELEGKM